MIAVTGATGRLGRALIESLSRAGCAVTAVARNDPGKLAALGVKFEAVDLPHPSTLRHALTGADAIFLLAMSEDPESLMEVIDRSGVRRVVLLSSIGAGSRPSRYAIPAGVEDAVRGLGCEWTILRPGGFASNTLAWAATIRSQRKVFAPFIDVALPVVDPADVADVASTVLMHDGHQGRVYELTGPRPSTPREQVMAIGAELHERVEVVEVSRDVARSQMTQMMPAEVAEATLDVIGDPLPSERQVSPAIEAVLGRKARSYREWAESAKGAFQ